MSTIFSDLLHALLKLALGVAWLLLTLLTSLWGYAIYKSIGRVQTESDAGEFLTPNDADMYPVFFVACGFLLFLTTLAVRRVSWPWPKPA